MVLEEGYLAICPRAQDLLILNYLRAEDTAWVDDWPHAVVLLARAAAAHSLTLIQQARSYMTYTHQ